MGNTVSAISFTNQKMPSHLGFIPTSHPPKSTTHSHMQPNNGRSVINPKNPLPFSVISHSSIKPPKPLPLPHSQLLFSEMHSAKPLPNSPSPLQFPSPVTLLQATRILFPASPIIPRAATSISGRRHNQTSLPPAEGDDDSVAAFWDYQFLFVSQRSETAEPAVLRAVDGAVPADFPGGTYYLAGPGLFADDHGSTVHPLDGHGYLRAFGFENKEVKFTAKYVRTEAQMEEHEAATDTWRFTHRGPFSVLKGGKRLGNTKVMKNVANTSVLRWAGRLLCLWEGGDPYEIQPGSLDTIGKFSAVDVDDDDDGGGGCGRGGSPRHGADLWRFVARLLKPLLHGSYFVAPLCI